MKNKIKESMVLYNLLIDYRQSYSTKKEDYRQSYVSAANRIIICLG